MANKTENSEEQDSRNEALTKALAETLQSYIPAIEEKFRNFHNHANAFFTSFQGVAKELERKWQGVMLQAWPVLGSVRKVLP